MIRYVFGDDPLTIRNKKRANPQKIGERLAAITSANGGRLTPGAVVADAKATSSPLHRHFEWDDQKAADAFRLEQARDLVRCIHIEPVGEEEAPRAFLSVNDKAGVSYRTLGEVRGSADLQLLVLEAAERDLAAFELRYRQLTDICEAVREAREKVRERRLAAEARPS